MIKDPDFRQISRQITLSHPTQLFKEIFDAAAALVDKYWDFTKGIRMLTVTGINLVSADTCEPEQLTLLAQTALRSVRSWKGWKRPWTS